MTEKIKQQFSERFGAAGTLYASADASTLLENTLITTEVLYSPEQSIR